MWSVHCVAWSMAVDRTDWIDVVALGRRITRRRERLGIRQAELARRAGLSEAYVNRLENGIVRNPKVNDLAQISESLLVPLASLLQEIPLPIQSEIPSLIARNPRLSVIFATLAQGLELASHEDRQYIFEHLELVARRFGETVESAHA
jgi:transcriptional regulator with XRE-family HTH domain